MKILAGVDDSKFATDIVRAIAAQYRPEGTDVLVLHVVQPIGSAPPQMHPSYAPELEEERKAACELVNRIAEQLRKAGFSCEARVEIGDIPGSIIDAAAAWGSDLIVLGSHGQRAIQRLLLGSVSEFVARHAACSVAIIRMPQSA